MSLVPTDDVALVEEFKTYLVTASEDRSQDPEDIQDDIVARILRSENLDELLGETTALHARDLLGDTLMIHGAKIAKSDLQDSAGYFMIIDATLEKTGERVVVTCGAVNVMAQLYAAQHRGWFPFTAKFEEPAKATANGFKPLWLRKVDDF